jgi:hypothetical protein
VQVKVFDARSFANPRHRSRDALPMHVRCVRGSLPTFTLSRDAGKA